jgi:hypothetical protein
MHRHFILSRRDSATGASGLGLAGDAPAKPVRISGIRRTGKSLIRKGLFFMAASSFHFTLKLPY